MIPPQGEGGEPPPIDDNKNKNSDASDRETEENDEIEIKTQQILDEQAQKDKTKAISSTCKPVAKHRQKVELPSHRINVRI